MGCTRVRTEMQIFVAAREVLHNNEQSHNLICVLCVSSSPPYSWEERVYVGLFLPGSFSQQVSSDNVVHDMHVLILEKPTLGAGQEDLLVDLLQHTEADSQMSPSETQQENDKFSGGQDNGS